MTLYNFIHIIERICLSQKNVRSFGEGDLYSFMASPSIKYSMMYVTQNQHQRQGDFDLYNINLFYMDRNNNVDADNSLEIQSIGKELIDNVIRIFCEDYDAEVNGNIIYQPFTQSHPDLVSGVYATVTLEVPVDSTCID